MKTLSISVTELEDRLIRFYALKRGCTISRCLVKPVLAEAELWVRDNGFFEDWGLVLNGADVGSVDKGDVKDED